MQEYNEQASNIQPFAKELVCSEFVDKNLNDNNKYDNNVNEYINNNLIQISQNLFSHEYKNPSDIESGNNLIYLNTDCKFKVDLNDNNANIFAQSLLEEKIYSYYSKKIFYQNLLQLLCNQISSKQDNLPAIAKLNDALEFIEDESIIKVKKQVDENVYSIISNKLYKLFIFKQLVSDGINNAIWTKLYAQELSIDEIKLLITKNLIANLDFVSWIFDKLNLKEIDGFILQSICSTNQTVDIYQSIINPNFSNCLSFLIANKIDLELIYELFPNQINNYLNEQITKNNEAFLHSLKEKQIVNQDLQRIIISKLDKDYTNNQSYLFNSNIENDIIQVVNESYKLLDQANELNDSKLSDLYHQLSNQIDKVKQLDKNLNLTTLDQISNNLHNKREEIKLKLAAVKFKSLTNYALRNRKILEGDLSNLLGITYEEAKGSKQITDNQIVKQLLDDKQIKQFKDLQHYNSTFMHWNKAADDYRDQGKYDQAFRKLQEYNSFLTNLKNKISNWKKNNSYKELSKEKEGK